MHTNQQVRAHFSNISLLNYLPQYHRVSEKYDKELLKFLPEKYSYTNYYGNKKKSMSEKRKKQLERINKEYNEMPPLDLSQNIIITQNDELPPAENTRETEEIIIPQILKQKSPQHEKTNSATEKEDNTVFVPNIIRKNRTENESIIVPSILPTKTQKSQLETLPDDILLDSRRRSNRLKKPPDKLQM